MAHRHLVVAPGRHGPGCDNPAAVEPHGFVCLEACSVDEGQSGWWRRAVVYEIYIRSFADANGDGIGDIAGIRSHLAYLRNLGVDAVWITPWFTSPMADGGYDVADYRDIDPLFGSLEDAGDLVTEAHRFGLRVLIDLVPNHTSAAHAWFREAMGAGPDSPARARYIFRNGRGRDGDAPPNNWQSAFGGPAWTRVVEPDGAPGQWYLHLFAPEQPDLDWENPEVRAEFESILRFWFDRGVDGVRIDVANALVKDPALPELPVAAPGAPEALAPVATHPLAPLEHPFNDREGVHEIYRAWRRIAAGYAPERVLLGEVGVEDAGRLSRYLRPGELHGAFNFPFMHCPWDAAALRSVIDETLATHGQVGAAPAWVLSNHDATRQVTRLGRPDPGMGRREMAGPLPVDIALGTRRARAAALLMLALPGSAYLYQGEELGLWEVEDLPEEALRDPVWERSGRTDRGRDGCRVPLPWAGDAPPFGFGPPGSAPWLPQPAAWRDLSVAAESGVAGSTLELYRTALRLRRDHPGFRAEGLRWMPSPPGTLLFERGRGICCAVNCSDAPMPLPPARTTILASAVTGDVLGVDAATWFETAAIGGARSADA